MSAPTEPTEMVLRAFILGVIAGLLIATAIVLVRLAE